MTSVSPRNRRRATPEHADRVVRRFCVEVGQTIERRRILRGGETAVLAVSGGADSLALLETMHRLRERFDLTMHVAHMDHGVRPDGTADAEFVRDRAEALGLDFHLGAANPTPPKGSSLEEHLREERGAWLVAVAGEVSASRVLTGHTLDDQAETVLMNLLTGAGRRGLGGMPPVRWRTGRPLIDRRRAETEAFCAALDLDPRTDETNQDPAFLRNRLRLQVIPLLREVNPRLDENLAHLSDVSRDEDYFLDAAAAAAVPPIPSEDGSAVDISMLEAAPVALQRRAVRILARNEGLGLSGAQVEQILAIAHGERAEVSIDLDGPLSAWRRGGLLTLGRAPRADQRPGGDA